MHAAFVCLVFWVGSLLLETTVFTVSSWFQPNLFFLMSAIFCLHWRGIEGYYISLIYGLTSDCFSTLPFGIYGLTYFGISFGIRWYAIKILQPTWITLPLVVGFFTLVLNGMVLLLLSTFFSVAEFSGWFKNVLINEVVPTAVLSIVAMKTLAVLEKRYKIHLAERKF